MSGFWDVERDEGWQALAASLNERTKQFWAIDSISNAIKSALTYDEILKSSLERLIEVTNTAAAAIYFVRPGGDWGLASHSNIPEALLPGLNTINAQSPIIKLVTGSSKPVNLTGVVSALDDNLVPLQARMELHPCAAVEISSPRLNQSIIVLYARDHTRLSDSNLEVLDVIGRLIGLSLANTLAHEAVIGQFDRQLELRLAEMEAVLSSMSDGLLICDKEGRILRANKAAGSALGRPAHELLGESVLEGRWNRVLEEKSLDPSEVFGPFEGVLLRDEECIDCLLQIGTDDEPQILRVSVSRIESPNVDLGGAVAVFRNVTGEKSAQKREDEFLSLLSHELRAPLTVISGYAQMMSRKLKRQGLTEEAGSADLIRVQVTRMSAMVADLVESGRLEEGIADVRSERTDLGALAESTVSRVIREQRHGSEKHKLSIQVDPGLPPVEGDPRRLDQVMTNFLSNAIRYSPEGGSIDVKVFQGLAGDGSAPDRFPTHGDTNGRVYLTVTDQGIGVPPGDRSHVFERAFRGKDGQAVSAQGLGLGLYICKLIINHQGGEIGVTDGPDGVGSTFWFALPVSSREETL